MATAADVHPGGENVLGEGVGHAYELLAIVPIEGKLVLTRGATFSYYEFKHPISDRLTDEKWQPLLKTNRARLPPVWTRTFLVPGKTRITPANSKATIAAVELRLAPDARVEVEFFDDG